MEKRKTILQILYRLTILFLLPLVAGCDLASRELREALRLAGDNRPELPKALDYFSDDPLKREACEFLIRHMPGHYTYGGEFFSRHMLLAVESCCWLTETNKFINH